MEESGVNPKPKEKRTSAEKESWSLSPRESLREGRKVLSSLKGGCWNNSRQEKEVPTPFPERGKELNPKDEGGVPQSPGGRGGLLFY